MARDASETMYLSPLDFLRTRTLTNVVQEEIERMLVEGELKPSERINENALAQQLGVSRGPIREACSALAAVGLMEIIPNRGFFVRSLSEDEARDLSQARAGIFAYAGMLLAQRITDDQLDQLRDLVARMDEAAETGEASVYYPLNLQFHDALLAMAGNGRLSQIYRGIVRELHIHHYRGLPRGKALKVSNAEHRAIVDALAAHDPQQAFAAVHAHVIQGLHRNIEARHETEPRVDATGTA